MLKYSAFIFDHFSDLPSASRELLAMSTAYTAQTAPKALFDYDKYWASCFEPAPFADVTRNGPTRLGQL